MKRQPSLKWPLILQPMLLNFVLLLISFAVFLALVLRMDSGGPLADQGVAPVIARAIVRQDDGALAVRMTPELAKLRAETPNFWFVVQDDLGHSTSLGAVPAEYVSIARGLRGISHADLRDRSSPYQLSAVIRREDGPAGRLTVLAHGSLATLTMTVAAASNLVVIPVFLLLALASVILIPWIVNRSLSGVSRIAHEAQQIEIDRQGIRLSEQYIPREIVPLVRAMNGALERLDEGYQRQRRFIGAAAHELRTPIAILRAKIDTAGGEAAHLLEQDLARLSTLTEQLLDLHRLEHGAPRESVDLAALARRVAADLAPLFIASDKTIEVFADKPAPILANAGAVERAVANLVQNAIDHGGRQVAIRVENTTLEVTDDGPGISPEERARMFEPFQRLTPRSNGTGLGLHLVQEVMNWHHGRVSIHDAPGGGTIVRVVFPML